MPSLCSSEPQAIAAVGRTKSHFHCCQSHSQTSWRKPTSHNFITEVLLSSAITSAKFITEKHFPFKESDFQCSLASVVYPGPSLVFTLISSVFLLARNHADLNCNRQKCNLQDKLGQNNTEEIFKSRVQIGMSWKTQEGRGIAEVSPYIPPGTDWVPWRPLHGQEMCVWLGHCGRIAKLRLCEAREWCWTRFSADGEVHETKAAQGSSCWL